MTRPRSREGKMALSHPLTYGQLERAVQGLGLEVRLESSGGGGGAYTVRAMAPDGYVWKSDGVHELVESCNWPGPGSWKHQLHADLLERIRMGVENCPDADSCEWCNPVPEEL